MFVFIYQCIYLSIYSCSICFFCIFHTILCFCYLHAPIFPSLHVAVDLFVHVFFHICFRGKRALPWGRPIAAPASSSLLHIMFPCSSCMPSPAPILTYFGAILFPPFQPVWSGLRAVLFAGDADCDVGKTVFLLSNDIELHNKCKYQPNVTTFGCYSVPQQLHISMKLNNIRLFFFTTNAYISIKLNNIIRLLRRSTTNAYINQSLQHPVAFGGGLKQFIPCQIGGMDQKCRAFSHRMWEYVFGFHWHKNTRCYLWKALL